MPRTFNERKKKETSKRIEHDNYESIKTLRERDEPDTQDTAGEARTSS